MLFRSLPPIACNFLTPDEATRVDQPVALTKSTLRVESRRRGVVERAGVVLDRVTRWGRPMVRAERRQVRRRMSLPMVSTMQGKTISHSETRETVFVIRFSEDEASRAGPFSSLMTDVVLPFR